LNEPVGALQMRAASGQAAICKNILSSFANAVTNDVELEYSWTKARVRF